MGQVAALGDAKALAATAQQCDQARLRGVDLLDDGQGAHIVELFFRRARLAHFAALREGDHAKGGARLMALAHHVQVAHFEHAQGQQTTWEQHGAQREKGQG